MTSSQDNAGLYGLKPTALRLPIGGWVATMTGAEHILGTIGPLSTSLEGCRLFTKTIIDAKPWLKEPSMLPFPWKEEDAFKGKKLKVAVIWDDGVVKPHPPITRALKQVADKLKAKSNVEVVDWTPYKHDLAWELIVRLSIPFHVFLISSRQTSISPMGRNKNLMPLMPPRNHGSPSQTTLSETTPTASHTL